jgi:hypothetical protein
MQTTSLDSGNLSIIRARKSVDDVRKPSETFNYLHYPIRSRSVANISEQCYIINKSPKVDSRVIIETSDNMQKFESASADDYDNNYAETATC